MGGKGGKRTFQQGAISLPDGVEIPYEELKTKSAEELRVIIVRLLGHIEKLTRGSD